MLKKILSILTVVVLAGYLGYSLLALTDRHEDVRLCRGIDLHITDSLHFDLIDEEMVLQVLQEHSIDPTGLPLDEIDLEKTEATLVRIIGFTAILYREAEKPEDRKFKL